MLDKIWKITRFGWFPCDFGAAGKRYEITSKEHINLVPRYKEYKQRVLSEKNKIRSDCYWICRPRSEGKQLQLLSLKKSFHNSEKIESGMITRRRQWQATTNKNGLFLLTKPTHTSNGFGSPKQSTQRQCFHYPKMEQLLQQRNSVQSTPPHLTKQRGELLPNNSSPNIKQTSFNLHLSI